LIAGAEITSESGTTGSDRASHPRAGWAEAFAEMAERGDDDLLDARLLDATVWDRTEWEW
jgi:hypothetical protein